MQNIPNNVLSTTPASDFSYNHPAQELPDLILAILTTSFAHPLSRSHFIPPCAHCGKVRAQGPQPPPTTKTHNVLKYTRTSQRFDSTASPNSFLTSPLCPGTYTTLVSSLLYLSQPQPLRNTSLTHTKPASFNATQPDC